MIGGLKDVVFEVSQDKIKTFRDLTRTSKAKYEQHNIIGKKPKLEFTGFELDDLQFTMQFSATLGTVPMQELETLRNYMNTKQVVTFTLGGKVLGKYVIEELGEAITSVDNRGTVIKAAATVKLKEYN